MPRREEPLAAGHYYHLYNRGNNRAPIVFEEENYGFFLRQVRKYLVADVVMIAYVLMPNHYHFLIQAVTDNVSHAMQLFGISYTKAINKRFDRVGALFQGVFQAKEVDRDEYLLHLSRYIHLNPVRAQLVAQPEEWVYSSYREYTGMREGTLPRVDIVMKQFAGSMSIEARSRYQQFVNSYVAADRALIAPYLF